MSVGGTQLELCWGTVERANAVELAEAAARGGYETIAVTPSMFADDDAVAVLRRRLATTGVRARVLDAILSYLPGSPDPASVDERFRASVSIPAARCLELAESLDCEIVNTAHFLGSPVEASRLAGGIAELAEQAKQCGRRLTVEFIPGTGIPDLLTTAALIKQSGRADVTIMLDTWHFARSGGTLKQLRDLPPGLVGGIQLSDRIEPPPGTPYRTMEDRLLPGAGALPLREMLEVVLPANRGVPVGVEVFSSDLRALAFDVAAGVAAAATRSVLPA